MSFNWILTENWSGFSSRWDDKTLYNDGKLICLRYDEVKL
jgi:hypothetical protein